MTADNELYKSNEKLRGILDKDTPDSAWNRYLKKYEGIYRVKRGEDSIWYIQSKLGQIKPYSLQKGLLGAYLSITPRKRAFLLPKLPIYTVIFQDAIDGLSLHFPEEKLKELESVLEIRRKRQLTEEHKAKLRQTLQQYRGEA